MTCHEFHNFQIIFPTKTSKPKGPGKRFPETFEVGAYLSNVLHFSHVFTGEMMGKHTLAAKCFCKDLS